MGGEGWIRARSKPQSNPQLLETGNRVFLEKIDTQIGMGRSREKIAGKCGPGVEKGLGKSTYKNRFREGRKGSFLFAGMLYPWLEIECRHG
jgi:hypothetical protein